MSKGKAEYNKFKKGIALTRDEAIQAMCYSCSGIDAGEDCNCEESCPLYQYMPYNTMPKRVERKSKK